MVQGDGFKQCGAVSGGAVARRLGAVGCMSSPGLGLAGALVVALPPFGMALFSLSTPPTWSVTWRALSMFQVDGPTFANDISFEG